MKAKEKTTEDLTSLLNMPESLSGEPSPSVFNDLDHRLTDEVKRCISSTDRPIADYGIIGYWIYVHQAGKHKSPRLTFEKYYKLQEEAYLQRSENMYEYDKDRLRQRFLLRCEYNEQMRFIRMRQGMQFQHLDKEWQQKMWTLAMQYISFVKEKAKQHDYFKGSDIVEEFLSAYSPKHKTNSKSPAILCTELLCDANCQNLLNNIDHMSPIDKGFDRFEPFLHSDINIFEAKLFDAIEAKLNACASINDKETYLKSLMLRFSDFSKILYPDKAIAGKKAYIKHIEETVRNGSRKKDIADYYIKRSQWEISSMEEKRDRCFDCMEEAGEHFRPEDADETLPLHKLCGYLYCWHKQMEKFLLKLVPLALLHNIDLYDLQKHMDVYMDVRDFRNYINIERGLDANEVRKLLDKIRSAKDGNDGSGANEKDAASTKKNAGKRKATCGFKYTPKNQDDFDEATKQAGEFIVKYGWIEKSDIPNFQNMLRGEGVDSTPMKWKAVPPLPCFKALIETLINENIITPWSAQSQEGKWKSAAEWIIGENNKHYTAKDISSSVAFNRNNPKTRKSHKENLKDFKANKHTQERKNIVTSIANILSSYMTS